MPVVAIRSVPLAQAFTGRANSFGLLRLCFAFAVLVAHTAVLGYGRPLSARVDVPGLAVAGFFGISGFLVTRSALRSGLARYLWHRALRILPGLWVCLLVTALAVAPWLWWLRHGTFDGLFSAPNGVWSYLRANWWTGLRQLGIGDVLLDTPYGRQTRASVLNGSLWTLSYEVLCYFGIAALAVVGILRRARWLVLALAVGAFGVLCYNAVPGPTTAGPLLVHGHLGPFPLVGGFAASWLLHYGFMFLLGALAELYRDRVPISDAFGVAALVVVGAFAADGALFGPALVAYEYVILWLAVRLPARLHAVGQRNDYSYGVYIYAFLVQQVLARFGVPGWGPLPYLLASALVSLALAALSWHLVERRALRLKDWTPGRGRWRAGRVKIPAPRLPAGVRSGAQTPG